MTPFKDFMGQDIDLDDPKTYEKYDWADYTAEKLYQECMKELGYALFYTQFLHPGDWGTQTGRINEHCTKFAELGHLNRKDTLENRLWLKKFLYIFVDEIENMC